MSRSLVMLLAVWLVACVESRDRHADQAARDASSDADIGDSAACPPSGEPAVDGCPCFKAPGDYCCRVGEGMTCTSERVWSFFFDGPCYTPEDDAGSPYPEPIDVVQCLR